MDSEVKEISGLGVLALVLAWISWVMCSMVLLSSLVLGSCTIVHVQAV